MNTVKKDVIVVKSLSDERIPPNFQQLYFTHILCHGGKGQFRMDNKDYEIEKNNIVILLPSKDVQDLIFSHDFKAIFLLISQELMRRNSPNVAWGIKGNLFSKENPVVALKDEFIKLCEQNFYLLKAKHDDEKHHFRIEIVNRQLQIFVMKCGTSLPIKWRNA